MSTEDEGVHTEGQASVSSSEPLRVSELQEVFGIECRHHYGITTHALVEGETPAQTVYRLIREVWHAPQGTPYDLTDDNHTWEDRPGDQPDMFGYVRVVKNDLSPAFATIGGWMPRYLWDGPGSTWFAQDYRIATRTMINDEIAKRHQSAERRDREAAQERDTIRGRKRRDELSRWARTDRRQAELIAQRWPQYLSDGPQGQGKPGDAVPGAQATEGMPPSPTQSKETM